MTEREEEAAPNLGVLIGGLFSMLKNLRGTVLSLHDSRMAMSLLLNDCIPHNADTDRLFDDIYTSIHVCEELTKDWEEETKAFSHFMKWWKDTHPEEYQPTEVSPQDTEPAPEQERPSYYS